ncbi:UNVERIFIED_ORG: hypothetical protein M2393_003562 [Pseudomonas psychrophila]
MHMRSIRIYWGVASLPFEVERGPASRRRLSASG